MTTVASIPSSTPAPPLVIPKGVMTVRAASKLLGKSTYQVLKMLAAGDLDGQTLHNAAGGNSQQVFGESVERYMVRVAGSVAAYLAQQAES